MICLATLTLAALGPWTYAGFLDDPAPPTPPAPASPIFTPDPTPEPAPAPVRYRMPDATGLVWEHADPAWLQTFVMDRNSHLVRACVNGSCR